MLEGDCARGEFRDLASSLSRCYLEQKMRGLHGDHPDAASIPLNQTSRRAGHEGILAGDKIEKRYLNLA
jgi:hypothetical protein